MSRTSPSVGRMVSVLNFLAQHPGRSFTLTDFINGLQLNRSTCHAILTGLVDAGYLYRAQDKTFVMGPGLVAVGRVAIESFSPLQIARPEMEALAEKFDALCMMTEKDGHESVVLAQAAAESRRSFIVEQGTRRALPPPFVGVYFAGRTSQDPNGWIAGTEPAASPEQRERMLNAVEFIRRNGFNFAIRNPGFPLPYYAPELSHSRDPQQALLLQTAIDYERPYDVGFLQAPVYRANQEVAFTLALSGFSFPIRGSKVAELGQALRLACDRIGDYMREDMARDLSHLDVA